ncbi:MAG: homoserine kinase [Betaproteobacteria bacterium]|jgi:homoserine kinase type II|nr:homoserine kinase [Betaproteobacteria bacterium]MDH5209223.1 homoserine kinase [Burkholderiaceae bacterium]
MAVFTPLSRAEAAAFLTQFALGELVELKGIASGIENTNYFLTTDRGRFVLTLFERLTFKQLPFYLELMRHLARRGLPVPEPQENRAGSLLSELKGRPAAIVTRLTGKAIREPGTRECALTGEVLARLHLAGRDFPMFQPHLRGIGWWKETVPRLERYLPDDTFHVLAEEVIFQDSFFRSTRFEKLQAGPIHADLFRDNVLIEVTPDGERIGGLIDFYFAGCSIWLFDLAVAMNDWCIDQATGAFDPPRAQAMLDAYHAVRPLTEDEYECWRTVLRAAALRFWISRLDDFHRPRAAELLTPHDPSHFERILERRTSDATLPWVSA